MKIIVTLAIAASIILLFESCEKEKIAIEKLEGYSFSSNPKNSTSENIVNDILAAVNRGRAEDAQENNEKTYEGLGIVDKNGDVEVPKVTNTDYMLVFNQQEFEKVVQYGNTYGEKPKSNIDFSKEFVFVSIHPSKFISGSQFFDEVIAEVENENTIQLKPSFSEMQYFRNENPVFNYGENKYQVSMYKIPKSKFQNINLTWPTGEIETMKMSK
jgi:hypothetical protein